MEYNKDWVKDLDNLFKAIKKTNKGATSAQNITHFDEPDLIYFCAVLSEIAYYQVSELEINNDLHKRLKVFPCDGLKQVLQQKKSNLIKNIDIEKNTESAQTRVFLSESAAVFAYRQGKNIFFAFRGTVSALDWRINFDFKKKSIIINPFYLECYCSPFKPAIKFHQGFAKEVVLLLEEIKNYIKEIKKAVKEDLQLFFTGHSQGGAMASIASHIFYLKNYTVASYAFGAPRYMSAPLFENNNYPVNIVRHGDIVPYLPPKVLGYDDFFFKKDLDLCEIREISTLVKLKMITASFLNGHINHKMERYREELSARSDTKLPSNFFKKILNVHNN